jgi:SAM-dependent methyltransferase
LVRRIGKAARLSQRGAFSFIEVGAGDAQLSHLLVQRYPESRGTAIDWVSPPEEKEPRLKWVRKDLNRDALDDVAPADVVICVAVLEHVISPPRLVEQMLSLLEPGGTLFMLCPNYKSVASRLMKTRWPFFIPGEHINVPTIRGVAALLERASQRHGVRGEVFIQRAGIEYPAPYLARFAGLSRLAEHLPKLDFVPWPVGILEFGLTRR